MRWADLFEDLEAQADVLAQAERAAVVETRTRGEVSRLTVHDRMRGAVGSMVRLRLAGGLTIAGVIRQVGPDWLLVEEGAEREVVIPGAAVLTVRGLGRLSAVPGSAGAVESRLALRSVLRAVARDRSTVRVCLTAGGAEVDAVNATIDRVGADFIEIASHAADAARRRNEVREVELVPIAAIAAVRRGR